MPSMVPPSSLPSKDWETPCRSPVLSPQPLPDTVSPSSTPEKPAGRCHHRCHMAASWRQPPEECQLREKCRRSRRRRSATAPDAKQQQQLRQPHCHSNIWLLQSAAAGQLTAWGRDEEKEDATSSLAPYRIFCQKNLAGEVWSGSNEAAIQRASQNLDRTTILYYGIEVDQLLFFMFVWDLDLIYNMIFFHCALLRYFSFNLHGSLLLFIVVVELL